jgi:cystathionine beta-lyase
MAENVCVCTAPSKTFNLAGLQMSNIWIPGEKMREEFMTALNGSGYTQPPLLGIVACEAAYRDGREWFEELKEYLIGNLNYVRSFLEENIPQMKLVEPDGMYFAWIDCSGLGLKSEELEDLISNKAGLWLDSGKIFGDIAEQFQRVVLACPRSMLEKALNQLKSAVDKL